MTTIITRAGKGSPLTNDEVDSNFTNLNTAKLELGGTYTSGTANALLFLNASKVVSNNANLTYDGTTLAASSANLASASITAGTISSTPVSGNDIANKTYVDTIVSSGITYHTPVKYEVPDSVGSLNATYNNGASGVGATLTNAGTLAAFTPDGITAAVGDRILVYNQTNPAHNGVYVVTIVGNASTAWVLTRASDADTYSIRSPNGLGAGDVFFVTAGLTGAGESYVCNSTSAITFGTTPITFVQISDATLYTAGSGLSLVGTEFSVANTGVTAATYGSASAIPVLTVNARGQITSVTNTNIAITAAAVSGLATSATTDTTNASNITSGTLLSARLSGAYTGVTSVGTLTAGTWNATVIAPAYGGTGISSYTVGDLLFADTTSSLARLSDVAVGSVLLSGGVGTAPTWGKVGLTTHVSGTLPVASGGTGATSLTGYVYGNGTGAFSASISIPNSATTATNANTASAIVARDASGNFSAGTITAALSGNASTASSATTVSRGSGNIATVTAPGSGTYDKHVLYATDSEFGVEAALATDGQGGAKLPVVFTWRGGYALQGGLKITGPSAAELGGNAVLHAGNYKSYAVSVYGQSHDSVSADSLGDSTANGGFYTIANASAGSFTGGNDQVIHVPYANTLWAHQIAMSWNTDTSQRMGFRTKHNGTWQGWRTVLSDANYGSYALPLSGGTVTGLTYFTAEESLQLKGIRGQFSGGSDNQGIHLFSNVDIGYPSGWGGGLPNTPSRGLSVWGAIVVGYGANNDSTFYSRTTFSRNGRTSAYTDSNVQLYTGDNTPPGLSFHRAGYSATNLWESDGELYVTPWTTRGQTGKLLAAGNYNNYAPTLTGGGASGTWGINITGNAATATSASTAGSAGWATYGQILDTRAGQYTPNAYEDYRATFEFTNQIVADWHSAMTLQGWHNGYAAWQIIGPASTTAHENWYLRSGVNTTWNSARTILHSGNYTSYVGDGTITVAAGAALTGGGSFTVNQTGATTVTLAHADTSSQASVDNANGNVIQDVTLDTYGHVTGLQSVNLDDRYYTESEINAYRWFHSGRDFPNGTLIETSIDYSGWAGDPWVLEIRGNSYGSIIPFDIQYQGYIYNDTVINHGGVSNGTNLTGLVLFNYNGKLCFWFPNQTYWQGFNVYCYSAYSYYPANKVTAISNVAKPAGVTKEVALTANIRQSLHSGNYTSYAIPYTDVSTSGGASKILKTETNGYLYLDNWIRFNSGGLFSTTNGAHLFPNDGSYGAWKVNGSRNGWAGIEFDTGVSLMANSNQVGFHRNGYGWQMWWTAGTGYVHKGDPGGGTQATILDSSNYTNYTNGVYLRSAGHPGYGDWNSFGNTPQTVHEIYQENFNAGTNTGSSNFPVNRSYSYGTLVNFSAGNAARAQVYISHSGNDLIFRGGWGTGSWQTWNKVLTDQNYTSYSPSLTGSGASGTWGINITGSAGSVAASNITGQTGMWTSAARPGPYRLYRRDDNSDYSVQTYWTGARWRLYGYSGDTTHADTHVGYADSAGSAGLATDADRLTSEDNRTVAPSELAANRLKFGFTSWNNNNTDPWADFLHLRSYADSSGGKDNMVLFLKNGIGMRIWQQDFGSATAYATYVDVLTSGNFTNYVGNGAMSVAAGGGLTGGGQVGTANQTGNTSVTISHADTSSQASLDNSNGVVIQDVGVDTYGHVISLGTVDFDDRYLPLDFLTTTAAHAYNSSSGTWITGTNTTEWGSYKPGNDAAGGYAYNDAPGWVQFNVPSGYATVYIGQLRWSSGGYFDVHAVKSDGALVFRGRYLSRNTIENTNEGGDHDGQQVIKVSGLDGMTAVRITNVSGRLHLQSLGWSKEQDTAGSQVSETHWDLIYNRPNYGNNPSRNVWQISNWNQTDYPNTHFLSSENSASNAPTTDFTYGLQTSFHRDGASYRAQMVTSLYSDTSIWVRNSRDSDVWTGWKLLLHSGNYNSYAPTLTGTGASGTWGISITGNAATATTATSAGQIDGIEFRNGNSNSATGPDNITDNGHGYITSVSLFGQTDGALYSQAYNSSWVHQIYGDYRTGQLAVRGRNSGTWQSWRAVLDSSNYSSYALPLSGGTMTGTIYSSASSIIIGQSGGTTRGYLYNDSGGFGFLTNLGAWAAYVPYNTQNFKITGDAYVVGNLSSQNTFGFRNRLINGSLSFWQRGTGQSSVFAPARYTADRWYLYSTGWASWGQSTDVPSGQAFSYSIKFGRPSGNTATSARYLYQVIESINMLDLAGKTVTFSYWVKAGANFSGYPPNVFVYTGTTADQGASTALGSWTGSAQPVNSQIGISSSSWTRFCHSFTVASNAKEMAVGWYYTPTGTAGADDNLYIAGVEVQMGSFDTTTVAAFDLVDPATELQRCQRYYEIGDEPLFYIPNNQSITSAYDELRFAVTKRVIPTITASGWTYYSTGTGTAFTPSFQATTSRVYWANAGFTNWYGWAAGGTWTASAEL